MARNGSGSLFIEGAEWPLGSELIVWLAGSLALVGGAKRFRLICLLDQLGMKLWVRYLHALVDLAVDALLSGLLGSDGLVVVGVIQFLDAD